MEPDFYAVLTRGGVWEISGGALADRPAPGSQNRVYLSFDEPAFYWDTGAGWRAIGASEDAASILQKLLTVDTDTAGLNATTLRSLAPADFARTNDTRIPTQGENDALVGNRGAPSSTNRYVTEADKGVAGGAATLDPTTGKLVAGQIPDTILGTVDYQGAWNASTNTPTLDATGTGRSKGDYYVVSVGGSTNLAGKTDWQPKDWIVWNGAAWEFVDNTDSVTSVNGRTGAVTGLAEGNHTHTAQDVGAIARVKDEGTLLAYGTNLNLIGAGILASRNATTGDIDVTVSGAAAGAATPTAMGIIRAQVSPASGDPVAVVANSPHLETFVEGLWLRWDSGTALTLSPGAAWVPGLNRVLNVPASISLTGLAFNPNAWYYAYLSEGASGPVLELQTTAPVLYKGMARVRGGGGAADNARRFLGTVRVDGAGAMRPFRHRLRGVTHRYMDAGIAAGVASPYRVLQAGVATTNTNISCASVVPPHATEMLGTVLTNASAAAFFGVPGVGDFTWVNIDSRGAQSQFELDATQTFYYRNGAASGGTWVDCYGFFEAR